MDIWAADAALASFADHSQRLDEARRRFSDSPPSYRTHQSHNSTLSHSPTPTAEERRLQDLSDREFQLITEHRESLPCRQFEAQTSDELKRLLVADADGSAKQPVGTRFDKVADENIKNQWIEQGIWDENWDNVRVASKWKHEAPLEMDLEEAKTVTM